MRFFCLKRVQYNGNRNAEIFDPNARRLPKLEPNEISLFSIFRDPIYEIDLGLFYFKYMDQKIPPDPIGPDRTKISEFAAEIKLFLAYLGDKIK